VETDHYVLGIDIGGSHITTAMVDMSSRSIMEDSYTRQFINSLGSVDEILTSWCTVITATCSKAGVSLGKIGIAMPGPFNYEEGISYIINTKKYDALYGLNVKNLLAEKLNIAPANILMKNDAACFIQGEVFAGVAKGCKSAIGITLGTGLGTSVFKDGTAVDAELWCTPFLDGIAEDYISTRWFLKRYYELSGLNILNVKELAKLYTSSTTAKQVFNEFALNLTNFLQVFIDNNSPEMVVIGGNIANASTKFLPKLKKQINKPGSAVSIQIAALKENAAIIGAASCWHQ